VKGQNSKIPKKQVNPALRRLPPQSPHAL